jgi:hypothetical protein
MNERRLVCNNTYVADCPSRKIVVSCCCVLLHTLALNCCSERAQQHSSRCGAARAQLLLWPSCASVPATPHQTRSSKKAAQMMCAKLSIISPGSPLNPQRIPGACANPVIHQKAIVCHLRPQGSGQWIRGHVDAVSISLDQNSCITQITQIDCLLCNNPTAVVCAREMGCASSVDRKSDGREPEQVPPHASTAVLTCVNTEDRSLR